jgi:hypothetical protein
MRLGVTGRSRTGTGGVTTRSSAIELRPHPSARADWSRWQVSNPARRLLYRESSYTSNQRAIRSRVPAPPNRCGRFPPSKRELDEGSLFWHRVRDCSGSPSASGPRLAARPTRRARRANPRPHLALRSSGEAKEWCPWPSRRTRHVADPLRLCPNASVPSDVVSRCTWSGQDRAHPGPPTPCHVATECKDTPEVERMTSLELVASAMAWPRSAH